MELQNGLRELTEFAECFRLANGDFARLRADDLVTLNAAIYKTLAFAI